MVCPTLPPPPLPPALGGGEVRRLSLRCSFAVLVSLFAVLCRSSRTVESQTRRHSKIVGDSLDRQTCTLWPKLMALALFGVAFAYVEAAVVVYLREIYEPLALDLNPLRNPGDLFPLITLEQLEATDSAHLSLLKTEVIRESATIMMLASLGLAVGWNFNTCFAGFVIAFGIWDIFYYVFLKSLINWPDSLLELDLLFLIPVPWVGPVLAPVLVAICMVVAGTLVLWRESSNRPVSIGWQHWLSHDHRCAGNRCRVLLGLPPSHGG